MSMLLVTQRMGLREFTTDDVDLLFELDNDPDVMRFINNGAPVPRSEIIEGILPAFLACYERGHGYGFWAAVERSSNRFLGLFQLDHGKTWIPSSPNWDTVSTSLRGIEALLPRVQLRS